MPKPLTFQGQRRVPLSHVWLTQEQIAFLKAEADRRNNHPDPRCVPETPWTWRMLLHCWARLGVEDRIQEEMRKEEDRKRLARLAEILRPTNA